MDLSVRCRGKQVDIQDLPFVTFSFLEQQPKTPSTLRVNIPNSASRVRRRILHSWAKRLVTFRLTEMFFFFLYTPLKIQCMHWMWPIFSYKSPYQYRLSNTLWKFLLTCCFQTYYGCCIREHKTAVAICTGLYKVRRSESNMGAGMGSQCSRKLMAVSGFRIRDHHSVVHNYTPLCIWVVLTGLSVI